MTTYLQHHGILGQKWGKQNGPPYPLGASDHSASEKKADWRKSLDKTTDKGENESDSKRRGLSDNQRKAIKTGAIIVASGLVLYGGYRLTKSGKLDLLIDVGKKKVPDFVNSKKVGDGGSVSQLKIPLSQKTGQKITSTEAMVGRNPMHFTHNCENVSLAVAYAYNGHGDMIAKDKSFYGNLHEFIEDRYENGSEVVGSVTGDSTNIQQRLSKQILKVFKDGDVGIVTVEWDQKYLRPEIKGQGTSAGHAFNFFVEGGKVIFKDAQPDPPIEDASYYFKYINPSKEVEYCCIDDSLIPKVGALEKSMERR